MGDGHAITGVFACPGDLNGSVMNPVEALAPTLCLGKDLVRPVGG